MCFEEREIFQSVDSSSEVYGEVLLFNHGGRWAVEKSKNRGEIRIIHKLIHMEIK